MVVQSDASTQSEVQRPETKFPNGDKSGQKHHTWRNTSVTADDTIKALGQ
jgi:hypothetical protein